MQNFDFEKLSVALKKAADIEITKRVKTFFDVSGFPHYENVISNILAFFFDVNEEHGFKDLWLKSLFECYNMRANTNFQPGEFEEIEREHSTEENKRLDIIVTLDNTIVAIENKIFATPYNPFDFYHREILNYGVSNKHIIEILLSLKKEDDQITTYNTVFFNITYESLIEQVKKNLGSYICDANEKWLLFMKEVIINIENLGEGENMNKEWQSFLKESEDIISKFFDLYSNDIQSKITFIKNLEQGVKEQLDDYDLKIGIYNTQNSASFKGHLSLFIDIPKGDNTIVIEPRIIRQNPVFLFLDLWNRKSRRYDWSNKRDLFVKEYPAAIIDDDDGWGKFLRLESFDFEKGVSLDVVIEKIVGIVRSIKG